MSKEIRVLKWEDIDSIEKQKIERAPLDEWGHIAVIVNTEWSTPNYSLVVNNENREIVGLCNLIVRSIRFGNRLKQVVGISNLIVDKSMRGKGLGKSLMLKAQSLFAELSADSGLLLCGDDVIDFYIKLGWKKHSGDLYYDQGGKRVSWLQNVLLFPEASNERLIDLCGNPW